MDSHIILAGQSNGLGFGNSSPAPYTPTARVQIWTDTNGDGVGDAWHYMLPGVNTGTTANPTVWGPEVAFANAWLADHPDGVLWIDKVTKGSVGLAQDPGALDWSPASRGEEFDIATASFAAAKAALAGTAHAFSAWDAALWMQGETDATDPAKAQAYGANLRELIADARAEWDVGAFVVGRIGDGPALPFSEAVRDSEWELDHGPSALAGVQTFKTLAFETQADGLHLDASGQLALGQAFYEGWLA